MNELQAKLLRRREINGEVNPESKIDNIPSIKVEDSDIKPLRISPKSKFPIQVKGPIQTFSPTTIPEIIQNSIVEPSAVNKPVRPKVVGLKPASFNKPESKELNTNQVIVKSAALIDETDTIPDMEVTVDTSNLAVFTTPTLVVNVSEPMKMVPQENVNEDISSHLLTHRDNVISFNASITESTSVPIASYTTVTSTSIVELQPSFPSPVANTTGTTSRSSLFDDDDDDEVFKRVIIKPVEENISNSSSFIEVNNKKLSTLRSSTDSESFDLSAVADAVKEVNNVVAGLEVPTGPRNIQDISINLRNAHEIHTDTVKSVTPQHITEMLLENERLIAKVSHRHYTSKQ